MGLFVVLAGFTPFDGWLGAASATHVHPAIIARRYVFFVYRLLCTPFEIVTVVMLLWRNMGYDWLGVVVTLAPAIVLLILQVWCACRGCWGSAAL